MVYLLRLNVDTERWEEVDEYTYKNRGSAVCEDGETARYSPDWAIVNEGTISCNMAVVSVASLAILAHYTSATLPQIGGKGFVQVPETIKFKRGKGISMYELKTGMLWKRSA